MNKKGYKDILSVIYRDTYNHSTLKNTTQYCKRINQYDADLVNERGSVFPAVRQEPDNTLNLLAVDFWLWYWKVTPKGMVHAFEIKFWEMFNTPGYYDILTEGWYKMPNSNDGCMWLQAPTACPKWNEGTDEDVKVLQWLSIHAGLTSECVSEVIEPFSRQQAENTTNGMTWIKILQMLL